MRDLDDDAAYMLLATSNAQGELSALERGMHALHSGLPERTYADQVGRAARTVGSEMRAARVGAFCADIGANLGDRFSQLVEIHAASCAPYYRGLSVPQGSLADTIQSRAAGSVFRANHSHAEYYERYHRHKNNPFMVENVRNHALKIISCAA